MRVKISSPDGLSQSTTVNLLNDDGSICEDVLASLRVHRVELSCDATGFWHGVLHVYLPRVDVIADVEVIADMNMGNHPPTDT